MATQLTNYQCPACTGPLHFDGASGKLVCDFCGSSYDTAEIEALYAEKEAAAETAAQNKQAPPPDSVWSENEAAGLRSYSCPSCGAELICDETTAATSCPYCGNPTVIAGQFSGMQRPELVLPFVLDKNAAKAALKKILSREEIPAQCLLFAESYRGDQGRVCPVLAVRCQRLRFGPI